jgi:hypothetical protein
VLPDNPHASDAPHADACVRCPQTHRAAAALQGEQGDWLPPDTENFNLIPTKEFGYAMLRMPL